MADSISKERRGWNMSRIPSKNTRPEMVVRSILHQNGYRFRLHRNDLPGKPDVVLPKFNTSIFVNGCFWHRHKDCKLAYTPKSNVNFWNKKFDENIKRDKSNYLLLKNDGWNVIVIWECEVYDTNFSKLLNQIHFSI